MAAISAGYQCHLLPRLYQKLHDRLLGRTAGSQTGLPVNQVKAQADETGNVSNFYRS